jgi:conjugal transfer pilus assembly protein TraD
MLLRKYEMPWRRAWEGYAACMWLGAVAFFAFSAMRTNTPFFVATGLAATCLLMAILRWRQTLKILDLRASLAGRPMETISHEQFRKIIRDPKQIFLGLGFEWQPVHSQRLYELAKINYRDFVVGPFVSFLIGRPNMRQPDSEIGLSFIHGVSPTESAIYRPVSNFEGGTCIVGTTQSGKGVVLSNLIVQAIYRGDVVIIFDPKNSNRLKNNVMRACRDVREPDAFLEFHPAFPDRGVRFDSMFNWQKATELASRIQSIMPPDTSGSFSAFGWEAVNVVCQGLIDMEDRPNLVKLARYIDGGIEPILEKSLARFYDETLGANWRELAEMKKVLVQAKKGDLRQPSERATAELVAYVVYYERHIAEAQRNKTIDQQVRTFRHNREHYQKITANLLPILSMLTSGDLGRSLSPDPFDLDDKRPSMNLEKIDRGGHVFYIALDSLADPGVASAICGLLTADLAAYAGMRYNLGGTGRRISLFVDELSNVVNLPLIEILNKGAESGIHTTCAMQTFADVARRLGNDNAARVALGNLNNVIALRSIDRKTQEFVSEKFGTTGIHTLREGLSIGADAHVGDFSTSTSTQVSDTPQDMLPVDVLSKLPNCQYFGAIAGRMVKGRVPILDAGDFGGEKADRARPRR